MAKYHDLGIADTSFTAAADLTSHQYKFVQAGSVAGEVKLSTGASNPAPIGILQNSPSAGQEARVRVLGFSKLIGVVATCNLTYGRFLHSASTGLAQVPATDNGSPIIARWLSANVTSGSAIGEVLLLPTTTCAISAS